MDLVEQLRHTLDFVHNNEVDSLPLNLVKTLQPQEFRTPGVLQELVGEQQVYVPARYSREQVPSDGGLARLSRAEEEARSVFG